MADPPAHDVPAAGGGWAMLRETYVAVMHKVEGLKLVVTRLYPRGIARVHFNEWLPILAPSRELLADWRGYLITWEEYVARFREEILGSPEAVAALRHIIALSRTRDVWLICWEKAPPCHRFLLLDMARELSRETLPKALDEAGQLTLTTLDLEEALPT